MCPAPPNRPPRSLIGLCRGAEPVPLAVIDAVTKARNSMVNYVKCAALIDPPVLLRRNDCVRGR
jgi:hypothetical protein